MPEVQYRWNKVWAVNTSVNDEVQEGEVIEVFASSGVSKQEVLSVTTTTNKTGDPYKVLLVRAVED